MMKLHNYTVRGQSLMNVLAVGAHGIWCSFGRQESDGRPSVRAKSL